MNIEIYTGPSCQYCIKAKTLLKNKKLEYTEYAAADTRDALIARVEATGAPTPKTIPQIFIDDQYIGGFDQLAAFLG